MICKVIVCVKNDIEGLWRSLQSIQDFAKEDSIIVIGATESDRPFNFSGPFIFLTDGGFGPYNAMNLGLSQIVNEDDYILFLNAGDTLLPDSNLFMMVSTLSQSQAPWGIARTEVRSNLGFVRTSSCQFAKLDAMLWGARGFLHQSTIIRKSVFDKIGVFDTTFKICADLDLFCRIRQEFEPLEFEYTIVSFQLGGLSSKRRFTTVRELSAIRTKYHQNANRWYFTFVSLSAVLYQLVRASLALVIDRVSPRLAHSLKAGFHLGN